MSTTATWMLYGANGYTGKIIAQMAVERGEKPILAGRSEDAVKALAARYNLPYKVFSLDGPTSAIADILAPVAAVLHAAGPFSATSRPMVDACIASKTHYLDITGEISVFEDCHSRGGEAERAGISLMPGVGFDVVPSDCLAATLKNSLPDATHLTLAFTGGRMSQGTMKSMIEGLPQGGAVREDGAIKRVPAFDQMRDIPFGDKTRHCASIPWGDVSTAFYSTGIPNIVVYTAMPRPLVEGVRKLRPMMPLLGLPAVQKLLKAAVDWRVEGPSEQERDSRGARLWGEVANAAGTTKTGSLTTPDGYTLTALTALESAVRAAAGKTPAGFATPSMAFGANFIAEFDGCDLAVLE